MSEVRTLFAHSLWSFDRFYLLRPLRSTRVHAAVFDVTSWIWLIIIFFLCIRNRNFLCFIFISWFYFLYSFYFFWKGSGISLCTGELCSILFESFFPMDSSGSVPRTYYNLHLSPFFSNSLPRWQIHHYYSWVAEFSVSSLKGSHLIIYTNIKKRGRGSSIECSISCSFVVILWTAADMERTDDWDDSQEMYRPFCCCWALACLSWISCNQQDIM